MSELLPLVWLNGELLPAGATSPSIASISLHMGTGVFDGLMAYWTGAEHLLFRANDHFSRFAQSAKNMGMPFEWTSAELTKAAMSLVQQRPGSTCYVRPIAYRGGPELWLTGADRRPVDVAMFAVPTQRLVDKPITCCISDIERVSSAAMPIAWKVCGLYVNSYLARRNAERAGFSDGILLDRDGHVTEASAANIFLLNKNGLRTPEIGADVFPGITRRAILEICAALGIECVEDHISKDELLAGDAAFLCSTLMEIRPIERLHDRHLQTSGHPIYRKIVAAFEQSTGAANLAER